MFSIPFFILQRWVTSTLCHGTFLNIKGSLDFAVVLSRLAACALFRFVAAKQYYDWLILYSTDV